MFWGSVISHSENCTACALAARPHSLSDADHRWTGRARIVAGLARAGLPAAWLATVVEAARGDVTDAAQFKASSLKV